MKRDLDLVRRILLELETAPSTGLSWKKIKGKPMDEILYHFEIMDEAGLIESKSKVQGLTLYSHAKRLTWKGHEFLEAARDDNRWRKAVKEVAEKSGGLVLDILHGVLVKMMTEAVLGSKS